MSFEPNTRGKQAVMNVNNSATSASEKPEANAFYGLYRTVAWAYVTNGAMAFHVPEAEYRSFGYRPDYDSLPWKDSYDQAKTRAVPGSLPSGS
jgi:hypothetical protein